MKYTAFAMTVGVILSSGIINGLVFNDLNYSSDFNDNIIENFVWDARNGYIHNETIESLDEETFVQLQQALEKEISTEQAQLLTPMQVYALKAISMLSVGGLLGSAAGYVYSALKMNTALSGYLKASFDTPVHQEWIRSENFPANVSHDYVNQEISHDTAMRSAYKTQLWRSAGMLAGSVMTYIASIVGVAVASKKLKENEEYNRIVVNLQEALREVTKNTTAAGA